MSELILDVRERDEFEAEHIENSVNTPLSHLSSAAPGVLNSFHGKRVVIMCRSGNRAKIARSQLARMGFNDKHEYEVYDGGILEWRKRGHPTVRTRKNHLPILRQVQLIAGLSVFTFAMLAHFVNPAFIWGAAFFGAGLTVAGATGFCGMAELLAFLPWNRSNPGADKELCTASPSGGHCD